MILKIKAYRIKGDVDVITKTIRHITWREHDEKDLIIMIVESDDSLFLQLCNDNKIIYEVIGHSSMQVANDKILYQKC